MGKAIIAIGLLSGTVDCAIFTCWVKQILLPSLKQKAVVMDNATLHTGSDMQKIIANAGHALLYLPSYSPDLNPIEKKWAQAKQNAKLLFAR
jgi:transposase